MKILYLTTSWDERDYDLRLAEGKRVGNPSNQNFHARLIKSLKMAGAELRILSWVSFEVEDRLPAREDRDYLMHKRGLLSKIDAYRRLSKTAETIARSYGAILVDGLNLPLMETASKIKKRLQIPVISIITDNPFNLSDVKKRRAKKLCSLSNDLDGWIIVTKGLAKAYQISDNYLLLPGVMEQNDLPPIKSSRPYIYFAGSLLERYGAPDFLAAFERKGRAYDLYIAGHGKFEKAFTPQVKFLGQVNASQNASYQKGAALLVNPRPYDETLDREALPSKMFEYLTNGKRIASTASSFFKDRFPSSINWLGNEEDDFASFLDSIDECGFESLRSIDENERAKGFEEFGLASSGRRILDYLSSVIERKKAS